MSNYSVRPATRSDIPVVLELCSAMWKEHSRLDPTFAVTPTAQSIHRAWLKRNLARSDHRIVVAADKDIVGTGAATIGETQLFWPPRYGYLRDFYVMPAVRRHGIGSSLVADLLAWLETKAVGRVELMALAANPEARDFWTAMGFEQRFLVFHRKV